MNILIGFLYVVEVIVCLLLGLVVMLQKPKDGGLGGIAGGLSESVLGADASNVLIKVTVWLGAIFLANTLILARFTSTIHAKTLMADEAAAPAQTQQQPQMPEMPAVPAAAPTAPKAPAAAPAPASAPKAPVAAPAAAPVAPKAPTAAPAPAKPVTPAPAPAPKAPAAPAAK